MRAYWAAFARGDDTLAAPGGPAWPPLDGAAGHGALDLADQIVAEPFDAYRKDRCAFWDDHF